MIKKHFKKTKQKNSSQNCKFSASSRADVNYWLLRDPAGMSESLARAGAALKFHSSVVLSLEHHLSTLLISKESAHLFKTPPSVEYQRGGEEMVKCVTHLQYSGTRGITSIESASTRAILMFHLTWRKLC
jgi:hypothetical protein